ncbi:MAG: SRPBCC family protein [Pseudomonadota bacterium]|nr:SRPBCC family protein [Pseudomonadota bacterium]
MPRAPNRSPDTDSSSTQRAILGAGALLAAAGAALFFGRRTNDDSTDGMVSDAPPWTYKDRPEGEKGELIGRSQTINRPRQEIYQRWRDFARFPDFMDNVRSVERIDDKQSRWTIEAPAGQTVELVTEITHDVPGERIAWRSVEGSQIETAGEVLFKDAAPGRGTIVTLVMTYDPPGGTLGKLTAKLFRREPAIQARLDLRRFKQLLETGEVARNASPSARESESPTEARI